MYVAFVRKFQKTTNFVKIFGNLNKTTIFLVQEILLIINYESSISNMPYDKITLTAKFSLLFLCKFIKSVMRCFRWQGTSEVHREPLTKPWEYASSPNPSVGLSCTPCSSSSCAGGEEEMLQISTCGKCSEPVWLHLPQLSPNGVAQTQCWIPSIIAIYICEWLGIYCELHM
jgi:hypothetical protein